MLNRYRAGLVSYTDVVVAQVSAFNARRALVQIDANRQIAAIALIQALGGGWQEDQNLPSMLGESRSEHRAN